MLPLEEQVERAGGGVGRSPLPFARALATCAAENPRELPARTTRRRGGGDPVEPRLEEARGLVGRPEERGVGPAALCDPLGDGLDEEEIAGGAERERVGKAECDRAVATEPRRVAGAPLGFVAPAGRWSDRGVERGVVPHVAVTGGPPMAVDQPVAEHLHEEGPGVGAAPEALGRGEPVVLRGRVEGGEHPRVESIGGVGLESAKHRREGAEAHLPVQDGPERSGEQDVQRRLFAAPEGAKKGPNVRRRDTARVHCLSRVARQRVSGAFIRRRPEK